MDAADLDLQKAIALLGLPREVGPHPDTGEMIKAGIGRFGPFLVHQGKFKSIPADDPDGDITLVITVYQPAPELWEPDFRKRRP